jgi:hypothetical protein
MWRMISAQTSAVCAEGLLDLLPTPRLMVIDGAGHMGPLTRFREGAPLAGAGPRAVQSYHPPKASRRRVHNVDGHSGVLPARVAQ